MTDALKPIKDLPNLDGFEFIAVDKDGREVLCRMRYMASNGTFYIAGVSAFSELVGWRHKT